MVQMNTTVLACLVTLAVLSGPFHALPAPLTRDNLNLGVAFYGDRLLYRQYVYQPALPNTIQYQDVIYKGNYSTRISAIHATEVGVTQFATARVLAGGVGGLNVTLRVQSARGYGYYYLIDIWGR